MSIGQQFGRLRVIADAGSSRCSTQAGRALLCVCSCGTEIIVFQSDLKRGKVKSCGCLRRAIKHGHAQRHSGTYLSWQSMRARCGNHNAKGFKDYGGRGIKVCERWQGEHGLEKFLADLGERPPGTTLDRFPNNDGNYEPGNVRWATPKEQAANRKRKN